MLTSKFQCFFSIALLFEKKNNGRKYRPLCYVNFFMTLCSNQVRFVICYLLTWDRGFRKGYMSKYITSTDLLMVIPRHSLYTYFNRLLSTKVAH